MWVNHTSTPYSVASLSKPEGPFNRTSHVNRTKLCISGFLRGDWLRGEGCTLTTGFDTTPSTLASAVKREVQQVAPWFVGDTDLD